jgi:hypothetical protein
MVNLVKRYQRFVQMYLVKMVKIFLAREILNLIVNMVKMDLFLWQKICGKYRKHF